MAQKFGNGRWVKEGFLDNRIAGTVVGRITLAVVGSVSLLLHGDCKDDIKGQVLLFENPNFEDDDRAAIGLSDLDAVVHGMVHLISLDPHPLLDPHPYIEWFATDGIHYRIELQDGDARIATQQEAAVVYEESKKIRIDMQF